LSRDADLRRSSYSVHGKGDRLGKSVSGTVKKTVKLVGSDGVRGETVRMKTSFSEKRGGVTVRTNGGMHMKGEERNRRMEDRRDFVDLGRGQG